MYSVSCLGSDGLGRPPFLPHLSDSGLNVTGRSSVLLQRRRDMHASRGGGGESAGGQRTTKYSNLS